tara:strand:- start:515 stop:1075 length:561 start_codon:yes stop_codon:yes gene_type:complete
MENSFFKYLDKYIENFKLKLTEVQSQKNSIKDIFKVLIKYKNKNQVHIFGNGGSASIASHFSMDLTNNSVIKCISYNDPSIITCYSNDFKFENWISRTIFKYGKKNDLLILISSSGESKNMINAVKMAKKKKFSKIITFTGFKKNNSLKKIGNLNLWVDSRNYNVVENIHQFYLLLLVDMIKNRLR